ncbi:MAG TPA: DUF192 domain-containing protein [Drouetiella sp.]
MKRLNLLRQVAILSALAILTALPLAQAAQAKAPTVKLGDTEVKLEVAASEAEIERGLMYRTSLPEDQGMVFLFQPPRPVNFWMAHCFISLDMVFVKNGKVIKVFENVPPCRAQSERDCPTYPEGAGLEVNQVVEVSAGFAKRHNVKVGDPVSFDLPK